MINSDSVTSFAGLINFGKQVVYSNLFAVDYYIGAGYATGTSEGHRRILCLFDHRRFFIRTDRRDQDRVFVLTKG